MGRFGKLTTALIALSGAIVMLYLVALTGGIDKTPLNKFYYLESDVSGVTSDNIPDSPDGKIRWTLWNVCGVEDGLSVNCNKPKAGFSFDAPDLFAKAGDAFDGSSWYYLSRFHFAFFIITIIFASFALLFSLLSCFGRIPTLITGFLTIAALLFQTPSVAVMTTLYVRAKSKFEGIGNSSKLGASLFGFEWGAWFLLLMASLLFCASGFSSGEPIIPGRFGRRKGSASSNV